MTHTDVVSSEYFSNVLGGEITSEIRRVKTPITTGDKLILQERDENKAFTGKEVTLKITSAQNKLKGLVNGFALVHFAVDGANAVTTTVIPAEAQINSGVDRANVVDASGDAPALDVDDTLPLGN